ncbi:MAG: hypothetical protein HY674_17200 [Chloroflexi bacterium]|nr:hypothetical protein [Chloroflexota bacterium]
MDLVDFILNGAALLLWLHWRALGFVRPASTVRVSLLSTLKKAEPAARGRWIYLTGLLALLVLRSFFYSQIGAAMNWMPSLNLVAIHLSFRSDYLSRMFLFSGLSFGLILAGFYAWLLLLSAANRKAPDSEPWQKWVRLHLGWLEHWPALVKFFLPMAGGALLWLLASPGLVRLGLLPPPVSQVHLGEQAIVLGAATFLVWKFLITLLFLLYLLNSYVFLGNFPFWSFVNLTARNLLRPLNWLPLQIGKMDLAPLLGMALVLYLAEAGASWLAILYQRLPW